MQYSVDVRNAKMAAIVSAIGPSPVLQIRSGPPPQNCAARDSGSLLASMTLPAEWMTAAKNGRIAKAGEWESRGADANGDAGHFRIYATDGRCMLQGTVSTAGADMTVDSVGFIAGQIFVINSFSIADNNG